MEPGTLLTLAVLALVDSTSFGTLLIPIWLLMTPGRVRIGRVLLFLFTVTASYFAIGIALRFGASALLEVFDDAQNSVAFRVGQFVLGVALIVVSSVADSKAGRARAAAREASGQGRIAGWRARAVGGDTATATSLGVLMTLAVTAVLAEVATMVPYLAAAGIITAAGPGMPGDLLLLLGYCVVMILPAVVLTVLRLVARSALERPLARLEAWLSKNARSTTLWIIGIVGVILVVNSAPAGGWGAVFGG